MHEARRKKIPPATADDTAMRDQEVLRATRELAAYFKGGRTEREARSALKIIKAFIRDRERVSPDKRRPLPGVANAPVSKPPARRKRPSPPKHRRPRNTPAAPDAVSASLHAIPVERPEGDE